MSFDVDWDIEKYREDHESEDHWRLRAAFMERWKEDYPEERLVCLARVFANIEFMGCRYPVEVMQEVAKLSKEVAKNYRKEKKTKLQRTFVSASDAAEDRAKGIKREGGIIVEQPAHKSARIEFVKQGSNVNDLTKTFTHNSEELSQNSDNDAESEVCGRNGNLNDDKQDISHKDVNKNELENIRTCDRFDLDGYVEEMKEIQCSNVKWFNENMFKTTFGRMVLLIRPWASKLWNIQASCQACNLQLVTAMEQNSCTLTLNGKLLAQATGETKQEAKINVGNIAWNRLKHEVISVIVKEQWIAQDGGRISVSDVSKRRADDAFGTPVDNTVAMKMMKLMGWKGGGLGADAQGIEEPIKPHLQMVNRAGLGSTTTDISQLRKAAQALMSRYIESDTIDVDLVFSQEFTKEERAALHKCANRAGLASRSYGGDSDRFLVVKKKLDPFSIVRAVIEKGGNTPKYQVFIPDTVRRKNTR